MKIKEIKTKENYQFYIDEHREHLLFRVMEDNKNLKIWLKNLDQLKSDDYIIFSILEFSNNSLETGIEKCYSYSVKWNVWDFDDVELKESESIQVLSEKDFQDLVFPFINESKLVDYIFDYHGEETKIKFINIVYSFPVFEPIKEKYNTLFVANDSGWI